MPEKSWKPKETYEILKSEKSRTAWVTRKPTTGDKACESQERRRLRKQTIMKQLGEATKTAKHQTLWKQRDRKAPETIKSCESQEISAAGNWTRVFRVTGGNTNHYTTADSSQEIDKRGGPLETRKTLNNLEIEGTVEKTKRETRGTPRAQATCVKSWKLRNQKHGESHRNARTNWGLDKANNKSSRKAWSSKNN